MIHWGNIQKPCFGANLNQTWAHVMWISESEMIKSYYIQFVHMYIYVNILYNRNTVSGYIAKFFINFQNHL